MGGWLILELWHNNELPTITAATDQYSFGQLE